MDFCIPTESNLQSEYLSEQIKWIKIQIILLYFVG